jgi:hypothetical protein
MGGKSNATQGKGKLMRVTFIVKNLTESILADLCRMDTRAAYENLHKWSYGDLAHCVSIKIGSGAFRDRVEWNGIYKSGKTLSRKMESRKGYKLFTFEA